MYVLIVSKYVWWCPCTHGLTSNIQTNLNHQTLALCLFVNIRFKIIFAENRVFFRKRKSGIMTLIGLDLLSTNIVWTLKAIRGIVVPIWKNILQ